MAASATLLRLSGHQALAKFCGMGPPGEGRREFIVGSLQLISREFDDKLLNYCEFLGVLESAYWHSPINGLC